MKSRRLAWRLGVLFILFLVFGIVYSVLFQDSARPITTFVECADAGNPIMESYPRQCIAGNGEHFVENTATVPDKSNLIRLNSPIPNALVSSPLVITGEARGNWYFEASFPVFLTDWDGRIIAQGIARAQSHWMTTAFVPFVAELNYKNADISGQYSNKGTLILKKDNPSGLPQYDDSLEIPVVLK